MTIHQFPSPDNEHAKNIEKFHYQRTIGEFWCRHAVANVQLSLEGKRDSIVNPICALKHDSWVYANAVQIFFDLENVYIVELSFYDMEPQNPRTIATRVLHELSELEYPSTCIAMGKIMMSYDDNGDCKSTVKIIVHGVPKYCLEGMVFSSHTCTESSPMPTPAQLVSDPYKQFADLLKWCPLLEGGNGDEVMAYLLLAYIDDFMPSDFLVLYNIREKDGQLESLFSQLGE